MDFTHPLGVALCKVVVDRYDMHALARQRVQICGKGGNESFTFTRFHFRDTPLMQAYTADYLHVEMLHSQNAPARFPECGERVEHYIVKTFAFCKPFL